MPDPKFELELEAFYCCPYGLGPGKDGAYRMFVEVMIGKKKKKRHTYMHTHTHTQLYTISKYCKDGLSKDGLGRNPRVASPTLLNKS